MLWGLKEFYEYAFFKTKILINKIILKIPDFWQPTKLITSSETEEFPLPDTKFNSERAAGMCYEVREVNKCIVAGLFFYDDARLLSYINVGLMVCAIGLLESPRIPHEESLLLARLMDDIRKQVGVVFKEDLE